jgi:hypothetical protein
MLLQLPGSHCSKETGKYSNEETEYLEKSVQTAVNGKHLQEYQLWHW